MTDPLPRKPRSRVLHAQAEAGAELASAQAAIREAVSRLVEAHAALSRGQDELVTANRIVTQAAFVEREMEMAS